MGKKLLIFGAGGHGRVVREIAESMGIYEKIDFLDDNNPVAIGTIAEMEKFKNDYDDAFCAIGNNETRKTVFEEAECHFHFPILIHFAAYISPSAQIEAGVVIEPRAIVNTGSIVHKGSIISVGAIIDHDCVIREFVHVNAGAVIEAGSKVDAGRKVDAGSIVKRMATGAVNWNV